MQDHVLKPLVVKTEQGSKLNAPQSAPHCERNLHPQANDPRSKTPLRMLLLRENRPSTLLKPKNSKIPPRVSVHHLCPSSTPLHHVPPTESNSSSPLQIQTPLPPKLYSTNTQPSVALAIAFLTPSASSQQHSPRNQTRNPKGWNPRPLVIKNELETTNSRGTTRYTAQQKTIAVRETRSEVRGRGT